MKSLEYFDQRPAVVELLKCELGIKFGMIFVEAALEWAQATNFVINVDDFKYTPYLDAMFAARDFISIDQMVPSRARIAEIQKDIEQKEAGTSSQRGESIQRLEQEAEKHNAKAELLDRDIEVLVLKMTKAKLRAKFYEEAAENRRQQLSAEAIQRKKEQRVKAEARHRKKQKKLAESWAKEAAKLDQDGEFSDSDDSDDDRAAVREARRKRI